LRRLESSSYAIVKVLVKPNAIIPNFRNPQSINKFTYVLGNPLRFVDPSGKTGYPPALSQYMSCYQNDGDLCQFDDDRNFLEVWDVRQCEIDYYGSIRAYLEHAGEFTLFVRTIFIEASSLSERKLW
jgi:hypothetical protein